jgi:hypothetical protein
MNLLLIGRSDYPLSNMKTSLDARFENPNHKFEELVLNGYRIPLRNAC